MVDVFCCHFAFVTDTTHIYNTLSKTWFDCVNHRRDLLTLVRSSWPTNMTIILTQSNLPLPHLDVVLFIWVLWPISKTCHSRIILYFDLTYLASHQSHLFYINWNRQSTIIHWQSAACTFDRASVVFDCQFMSSLRVLNWLVNCRYTLRATRLHCFNLF